MESMESVTKSLETSNGANELSPKIEDNEIADDLSNGNSTKFDNMSTVSRRSDEPAELSFEKGMSIIYVYLL